MARSSHATTIVATLALLTFGLGFIAHGQGEDDAVGCPIYAVQFKDGKRSSWLTAADWVIFDTPNGNVYVSWDNVNSTMRIAGHDMQYLRLARNVIELDVIPDEEELP